MKNIDTIPGLRESLDKCQEDIQKIIGKPISVHFKIKAHNISMEPLASIVCSVCSITSDQLKNGMKADKYAIPRQVFSWFAYCWCKFTLAAIAEFLNQHHSTVIWSREKVNDMIDVKDQGYMVIMEAVKQKLIIG